jgi:hypothetical protein
LAFGLERMAEVFSRDTGALLMTASPCFVQFAILNSDALSRLSSAATALSLAKAAESDRDEEHWKTLFSERDLATFWWPTPEEAEEHSKFWFSTPLPQRHAADMPSPPWHFMSMIDAILDGEYDLLGVRTSSANEAVLEFEPHAYPYGGAGALRALVRAFGHQIRGFDDSTGYHAGDPMPPLWRAKNK